MPRRHPQPDPKPRPSPEAARRRARRLERRRRKSPPRPEPGFLVPDEIEALEAELRELLRIPNPDERVRMQIANLDQELSDDRRRRKRSRASSSDKIR